jgi:hypothetical protein
MWDVISERKPDPAYDAHCAIFAGLPGGDRLIEWYGYAPDFHDCEVRKLEVRSNGSSQLDLLFWRYGERAELMERHLLQITIGTILDLSLNGFAVPNIMNQVRFKAPVVRAERLPYYPYDPKPGDVEIEFEPTIGIDGFILGRNLSLSKKMLRGRAR